MILLSENEQESQLMTEEAKKAIDQAGTKTKCLLWTDKCIRFRAVDLADKIELPSVPIDEPTQ